MGTMSDGVRQASASVAEKTIEAQVKSDRATGV